MIKSCKDAIEKKIRKARTDPEPLPETIAALEARPEADNLVGIYAALAGLTRAEALAKFANAQFSVFKKELAELAVAKLGPIGAEMKRLTADPGYIDQVLREGGQRARDIAAKTMAEVQDITGLLRP